MPPKPKTPQPEPVAMTETVTGATVATGRTAVDTATSMRDEGDALTNEGVLDVRATGDGGEREEQVSAATQELEDQADTLDLSRVDAGGLIAHVTEFLLELFKRRPKSWGELSQIEQRDVCAALETNATELVRQTVEAVAREGSDPVRCLMVGFTDKGDDIKVELKVKAFSADETEQAVLALHRGRGKHVLVRVASADDFHERKPNDPSEPDQRGLNFYAGSDLRDEDLAGGEEEDEVEEALPEGGRPPLPEDTVEVVHTGDQLITARNGLCEARVNIKSGMLEALLPNTDRENDASWMDIREASPAELAAERERTTDFADA